MAEKFSEKFKLSGKATSVWLVSTSPIRTSRVNVMKVTEGLRPFWSFDTDHSLCLESVVTASHIPHPWFLDSQYSHSFGTLMEVSPELSWG